MMMIVMMMMMMMGGEGKDCQAYIKRETKKLSNQKKSMEKG